jgi:dienelactone hydrolase
MAAAFDDQSHYHRLYDEAPRAFACTAGTPEEVAAWQAAFRPRLRQALGLETMEADLAGYRPTATLESSEEVEDLVRERWRFWTEPDVGLPFYLLKRQDAAGRLPLVVCPHGHNHPHLYAGIAHSEEEARKLREGDRDIGVQAAREGYLALAPTTRAFGETRTRRDREEGKLHSCRIALLHGLLVGRTAIGERVWDMERLLDWALAREDVDPARVAMTGNSGGGTVTVHAAACDPRITAAVPSCYFCTYAGSIGSLFHCDCNYIPGILRLGEMHDVAGLIAPRPFCAIAGVEDEIFPIAHVRSAFAALQQIYAAAGAADRCRLYEGAGGHRYYAAGAWPFLREVFGDAAPA